MYVLVAMAELTAVGKDIQFWYPEIPTWVLPPYLCGD
ncbi:hypothetical protein ACLK1T_07020 [Escherichia coli]